MAHVESALEVNVYRLSRDEIDELLELRLLARLATFDLDGSIHVVPMWYQRIGDAIAIPTSRFTRKIAHLRRRPEASVVIDRYRDGTAVRGMMIQGSVTLIDGDEALSFNRAIHKRYVSGEGLESGPLARYLTGDDVTIRIGMDRVQSWKVSARPDDAGAFSSFLPLDF